MKTNTLMKNVAGPVVSPDFNTLFSGRARAIQSSAIREILKVTERPEVISFAGGLPAPETSVKETLAALERVLTTSGREALQYSTTEGFAPLREWIAARNSTPEAPVHPDQVLMVSGSQQGLDLLAKVADRSGRYRAGRNADLSRRVASLLAVRTEVRVDCFR